MTQRVEPAERLDQRLPKQHIVWPWNFHRMAVKPNLAKSSSSRTIRSMLTLRLTSILIRWTTTQTYRIPRVAVEHTIVIRATIGSIGMKSHVGHHSDRNCFDGMSNCHCVWAQFGWQVEICDSASCENIALILIFIRFTTPKIFI